MRATLVLLAAAMVLSPRAAAAEPRVVDVALSRDGSCAVTAAGKVYCWNVERVFLGEDDDYDNVPVPTVRPGLAKTKRVAVGSGFGCALDEGGVARCWGKNDHGQRGRGKARGEYPADMPDPAEAGINEVAGNHRFRSLVAATWHVCGITTKRQVACWGANFRKQAGGDGYAVPAPRIVKGVADVEELALGEYYSCARSRGGKVWCWGAPRGEDEDEASPKPTAIAVPAAKAISGDDLGACALTRKGGVWCWDDGKPARIDTPGKVDAIAGSDCVVVAGRAHCTAYTAAQLAGSDESRASTWVEVEGLSDIRELAVRSGSLGCAITGAGALRCFGYRGYVGAGHRARVDQPVEVVGLTDVAQIAIDEVSCALRKDGSVWCWGGNQSDAARATKIPGLEARAVATGAKHACATRTDGTITCWARGQGRAPEKAYDIAGIARAKAVSLGYGHGCAITAKDEVACWGTNYSGERGVLPTEEYPPATKKAEVVAGVRGATAIGCGACSSCASTDDGVWCWGCNREGQLGNGFLQERSAPARVVGMKAAKALSAGAEVTCAREPSGAVRCWGQGALTPIPWHDELLAVSAGRRRACAVTKTGSVVCGLPGAATRVDGLRGAAAVGVGDDHACALLKTGRVRCWGDRSYGVLGDGVPDFITTAVELAW